MSDSLKKGPFGVLMEWIMVRGWSVAIEERICDGRPLVASIQVKEKSEMSEFFY